MSVSKQPHLLIEMPWAQSALETAKQMRLEAIQMQETAKKNPRCSDIDAKDMRYRHDQAFSNEQKIVDAEMHKTVEDFKLLKNQQQSAEEGALSQGYHQHFIEQVQSSKDLPKLVTGKSLITHKEAQLIGEEVRLLAQELQLIVKEGQFLAQETRINLDEVWELIEQRRQIVKAVKSLKREQYDAIASRRNSLDNPVNACASAMVSSS